MHADGRVERKGDWDKAPTVGNKPSPEYAAGWERIWGKRDEVKDEHPTD
jgi:hypothetical protein